ncbi:uncharacterized protein LOC143175238 [Nomia melanderi]|uniref:uncharacterized protein LOC143175238 n=1 Tax=Nomia melanderi TaxID=2448451 RepID=UPI003FCC5AAF
MSPLHFARLVTVLTLTYTSSSIVLPFDILGYQQDGVYGDRGLITKTISVNDEHRMTFLDSIPCIKSFLKKHIREPSRSVLITIEDDTDLQEIVWPLYTWLKGNFAFLTHSPEVDFEIPSLALSAILLMPRANSLENQFYILDPCDRGCFYTVILVTKFEDEETFLADADFLARSMWNRRISILAILAKVGDSTLLASSLSFSADKVCAPSPPVVLDKCEGEDWKDLVIGPLPLNNCSLKVAYFEQSPYVFTNNGSDRLDGFEGILIEEIVSDLQVNREQVYWSDNTSSAEQVRMILYDDTRADLVVGRVLQEHDADIGYSTSYDMLKVVWVVPKIPKVSLKGLIEPFQPFVWAAIGGSLILGIVFKCLFLSDVSGLEIFALIIGSAFYRQPTRLSRRIHFIAWSIFGLFLAQVYIDSLADQLINLSTLKIETMDELMSSSIGMACTANFVKMIEKMDKRLSNARDRFMILDHEVSVHLLSDLLEGRNSSYAIVAVLNSSRSVAVETTFAYTMTTDVINSFPLALATWKGFPEMSRLNSRIQQFIDHGLFDLMVQVSVANDTRARLFAMSQNEDYKSKLHLQQFVPAFLLMIMGFAGGFILLVLEIALYPCKLLS